MRVLVILEVDPDDVIIAHHGEDTSTFEGSLQGAIEAELGWAEQSGISVVQVFTDEDLPANSDELGHLIKECLDA